ncbi:DUF1003 domain-containing protein [Frankia sp. QA3]|uniref:DUF1003 domain-containing protein n=1 Tax=Frankia sp. QA3 TaxID=710111 RepID=UPI000269C6FE|nr:DUF1003 domain-containing protein [Frankia sp. QA3]EIV94049.1 putative membrane protein [Frankia sp. QA3]
MTISASRTTDRHGLGTERLDLPVSGRPALLPRVDRETVSRIAETIARFLGTGRYLAIQTGIVIVWIALNIALPLMRWDPYPFILLNLAFSTQAAYAAPLILLAQNRQDDRDRASLTEDRAVAGRMREDTEFLTREVAALRLAQSEAATRQYVRGELAGQLEALRGDLESLLREAVELPRQPHAARRSGASFQPGTSFQPGADDRALTGSADSPAAARACGTGSTEDADGPGFARARTPKRPKGAKRARSAKVTSTDASIDVATARISSADGPAADGPPDDKSSSRRSAVDGSSGHGSSGHGSSGHGSSGHGSSGHGSSADSPRVDTASDDPAPPVGVSQAGHPGGISRPDETEPGAASSGPTMAHLVANDSAGSHPALPGIAGAPMGDDPVDADAARADAGAGGTATHRTNRATAGRGHHRAPLHAGSARRSAERPKSGDSPTVNTRSRHGS